MDITIGDIMSIDITEAIEIQDLQTVADIGPTVDSRQPMELLRLFRARQNMPDGWRMLDSVKKSRKGDVWLPTETELLLVGQEVEA